MDINEIQKLLPHRYPLLLIDRIVEFEPRVRIVAIKNISMSDAVFQGHFPGAPVFPGVYIIEAMAQTGAVLLLNEIPDRENKLVYFAGIDEAKFRKPVVPGDQLRLDMTVLKHRPTFARISGKAYVDGQLVAEAILSCAVADKPKA
jgi:3-hydroxyacyl-[acyl-carrier-protein] dehydratase